MAYRRGVKIDVRTVGVVCECVLLSLVAAVELRWLVDVVRTITRRGYLLHHPARLSARAYGQRQSNLVFQIETGV